MISYIKIYGPPVLEAIRELEKVAIDMPKVCIMNHSIRTDLSPSIAKDLGGWSEKTFEIEVTGFFKERSNVVIPVERCNSIISKHGEKLGEYDFFFEWHEKPETSEVNDLIEKIDKALKPLGCLYTITTK